MSDSSPAPKRRKEQRPLEILRAAIDLFGEQGFAHTTISAIAKRAGAAKGTVYLYFETKEALFEEAVRQFIKPMFSGIKLGRSVSGHESRAVRDAHSQGLCRARRE
ncbi:MAG: helix-turn-helix domain-containing protein [Pirellulaceae bacterium]